LDYTTGIEARAMGEVAIATTKLNVPKSNEIIAAILATHESVESYKAAPKGKTYQQSYDTETVLPSDEWDAAYEKGMKKLEAAGLPLQGVW
ncbi:MAG: monomethylamine:corrinoid methyltransferase, partial [Candidatus Methylarchaceae archaeon HK01B]|nr:monomethylamine:corrinoid methyltransferase [Candidatus Methylarchaceae archaeon HK01B]